MTSRLDRSCLRCGTLDECRVHAPDGRTVDDHVDEHNGGAMILEEIAALYGCTKEAVRLWEECALMKAAALAHKLGFEWEAFAANPGGAHARLAGAVARLRERDALRSERARAAQTRRRERKAGTS